MKDPEGVLEKQGPNTRHPGMIRFTDNPQVAEMESVIMSYLKDSDRLHGIRHQTNAGENRNRIS